MTEPQPARNQLSQQLGNKRVTRDRKQYVRRWADEGGGTTCTNLKPTIAFDDPDWKISISPGYVKNEMPQIGTTDLNDATPPTLTVTAATKLWLTFDWTPNAASWDDEGTPVYYVGNGGTISNVKFSLATTQPTETAPSVNETTGATTDGNSSIRWADVISDGGGGWKLSAPRCGSNQINFCAPDTWSLFFD